MRGQTARPWSSSPTFQAHRSGLPAAVFLRLAQHCWSHNLSAGLTGRSCDSTAAASSRPLEGPATAVLPLAARILADPRHQAIRIERFRAIPARRFANWSCDRVRLRRSIRRPADRRGQPLPSSRRGKPATGARPRARSGARIELTCRRLDIRPRLGALGGASSGSARAAYASPASDRHRGPPSAPPHDRGPPDHRRGGARPSSGSTAGCGRHYPHVPQGRIERMCRKGEIRVDGGRVRPATRLEAGQTVRLPPIPDEARAAAAPARGDRREADAAMIRGCVIYRDDDVIALNKPPGPGGAGRLGAAPPRRCARRGAALRARGEAAAGASARPRHLGRAAARPERPRRRRARPGLPGPRRAQDLLGGGRRGAEPARRHHPLRARQGAGPRRPAARARRCIVVPPDRIAATEGAKRATTDYAVIDAAGAARRLGGAAAGHRAHPPAPRPHGGDRPSDRRRRQVRRQRPGEPRRRLGRAARRRGQPQAAPARPRARARPSRRPAPAC